MRPGPQSQVEIFRGVYAPASLKLVNPPAFCVYDSYFPGRLRSGLIEADPLLKASDNPLYYFPGRLRSGLIEADIENKEQIQGLMIFRGVYAPASLKLIDFLKK